MRSASTHSLSHSCVMGAHALLLETLILHTVAALPRILDGLFCNIRIIYGRVKAQCISAELSQSVFFLFFF